MSTSGKVLGVWFDSEMLSWSLSEDKIVKWHSKIAQAQSSTLLSVKDMQKLMGHLICLAMMCPFLDGFRFCLNKDLGFSLKAVIHNERLCEQSKSDLNIWANVLYTVKDALPIPAEPCSPPVQRKTFTSDATGFPDLSSKWVCQGVASIVLDEEGVLIMAARLEWHADMLAHKVDKDGRRIGNKTTFLEFVGLLIPFLLIPECLRNQHVVLETDNVGCFFS